MKKILIFIIGAIFFIPIIARADMGAPEIKSYFVTPKSESGAKYYDYEFKEVGTVKYGKKIEISSEYKNKGVVYGYFYDDDMHGYVKLSEFKLTDELDDNKDEVKYYGMVFAKDGLDVYTGPSYMYEKLDDTIPYKAEVEVSDYVGGGTWIYVSYKGVKGYVNGEDGAIGIKSTGLYVDAKTVDVYKEYYSLDDWSRAIMVKDGKDFKKLSLYDAARQFYYEVPFKTKAECTVYKTAFENELEKVGTIPKGTKISPLYTYGDYGYEAYYVETDKYSGWVKTVEDLEGTYELDCFDVTELDSLPEDKLIYTNHVEIGSKGKNDPKNSDDNFFTPKNILILSICGGAIIVLTSIVTIILVNRKKKSVQE